MRIISYPSIYLKRMIITINNINDDSNEYIAN